MVGGPEGRRFGGPGVEVGGPRVRGSKVRGPEVPRSEDPRVRRIEGPKVKGLGGRMSERAWFEGPRVGWSRAGVPKGRSFRDSKAGGREVRGSEVLRFGRPEVRRSGCRGVGVEVSNDRTIGGLKVDGSKGRTTEKHKGRTTGQSKLE